MYFPHVHVFTCRKSTSSTHAMPPHSGHPILFITSIPRMCVLLVCYTLLLGDEGTACSIGSEGAREIPAWSGMYQNKNRGTSFYRLQRSIVEVETMN